MCWSAQAHWSGEGWGDSQTAMKPGTTTAGQERVFYKLLPYLTKGKITIFIHNTTNTYDCAAQWRSVLPKHLGALVQQSQ